MKSRIITCLCLFFLSLTFSSSTFADKPLEDGMIKKTISIIPNSEWAEINVDTVIDVSPKEVWSVITNLPRWPGWMPMNKSARFLSNDAAKLITTDIADNSDKVLSIERDHPLTADAVSGKGKWNQMAIEEYDLIWPLKNEWVVRNYYFDDTQFPYTAIWKNAYSLDTKDDGTWSVSPWKDTNKTLFHYYYRVKVKKGVPNSVFKTAVSFTVNSMIKALKREVAKH